MPVVWSYGVMTVPSRRFDLLPKTIDSLKAAGFDRPQLFVDGDSDVGGWWGQTFGLPTTFRSQEINVAGNWHLSALHLLYANPGADYYAVFQDDFVTVRGLKEYLSRNPCPKDGYMNLLTFPAEMERGASILGGKTGWFPTRQNGRGAVALVFPRPVLIAILSASHLANRITDPHRGWRLIDGGIVESAKEKGLKEYCHAPGLVRHVGKVSTMDKRHSAIAMEARDGHWVWPEYYDRTDFPGEDFDATSLLPRRVESTA